MTEHGHVFQLETPWPPASHQVEKRLCKMQTSPEEGESAALSWITQVYDILTAKHSAMSASLDARGVMSWTRIANIPMTETIPSQDPVRDQDLSRIAVQLPLRAGISVCQAPGHASRVLSPKSSRRCPVHSRCPRPTSSLR